MIARDIREKLSAIVGAEDVSEDEALLSTWRSGGRKAAPAGRTA